MNVMKNKIVDRSALAGILVRERTRSRKIVFTNGCFDVLHVGHVRLLQQARRHGDLLIVAINSDASVQSLQKGVDRPIHNQHERAEVLAAFSAVDLIVVFEESTPLELIQEIKPDVLVKGGDWAADQIVGREIVEAGGGRVILVPLIPDHSTTGIVDKIRNSSSR